METIAIKFNMLKTALKRFEQSLSYFVAAKKNHIKLQLSTEEDIAYTVARDSIIQRFEFSVEIFWKYLRLYLEEHEKVSVKTNTPRAVIRTACQARILSEEQADVCIAMVASRNLTSHIYKEDIAEQLARDIPQYYELLKQLVTILHP